MIVINRIQFRDQDETNLFTCTINPRQAVLLDDVDAIETEVIDGSPIHILSNFDGRTRRLVWDRYTETLVAYTTLRTELKLYKNSLKQIHLQDIDIQSLGFKNILVTNVGQTLLEGGQIRTQLFLEYNYTEAI